MTKYMIWRFDKKTKVPTMIEEGDTLEEEVVITKFKEYLKDKENSFALRFNR